VSQPEAVAPLNAAKRVTAKRSNDLRRGCVRLHDAHVSRYAWSRNIAEPHLEAKRPVSGAIRAVIQATFAAWP
jgi:hypothetical protein